MNQFRLLCQINFFPIRENQFPFSLIECGSRFKRPAPLRDNVKSYPLSLNVDPPKLQIDKQITRFESDNHIHRVIVRPSQCNPQQVLTIDRNTPDDPVAD